MFKGWYNDKTVVEHKALPYTSSCALWIAKYDKIFQSKGIFPLQLRYAYEGFWKYSRIPVPPEIDNR